MEIEQLVVCPWCLSVTMFIEDANEFCCSNCDRVITDEDLDEAAGREN